MIIRPMLDDWEVGGITSIRALERRRIARIGVPGLDGDLQQDLGHESLAVQIEGALQGDEVRDGFLTAVRERHLAGAPLSFVADIVTATTLEQVLVEAFEVIESNDWAEHVRYRLVLREYVEPPEPPAPFDALGAELGLELDALAELGLTGLELPALLGDVPTLGDPVAPLQPALDGVRTATAGLGEAVSALTALFDSPPPDGD
ncbi:MAG: hypothetical protein L6Q75_10905 [Burkholderiaceae bacterium]|nr:hypothetical protein [Burkholderiaceae bacterium]